MKRLAKAIGNLGFFAWVSYLCLWVYYNATRPISPQPEAGRLYRLASHGHIAYLTWREQFNMYLVLAAAIVLVVIAAAMALMANPPKTH